MNSQERPRTAVILYKSLNKEKLKKQMLYVYIYMDVCV